MTRNLSIENGTKFKLHISCSTNYNNSIQIINFFNSNYFKPHKYIENSPTHLIRKHCNNQIS